MVMKLKFGSQKMFMGTFALLFALAFLRVHMRVETTLIGYDLGRLKTREVELLAERSRLNMQLSQLTSRQHLQLMTSGEEGRSEISSLAAK